MKFESFSINMNYIKKANEAMRNKKYDVANKLYQQILNMAIPEEIKKTISVNIKICKTRIANIGEESVEEKKYVSISNDVIIEETSFNLQYLLSEKELIEYNQLNTSMVDWTSMLVNGVILNEKIDNILFYIRNWSSKSIVFKGFFDNDYYLESYKDIRDLGVNPLLHFLNHGIKEGRVGRFDTKNYSLGNYSFSKNKKNIIFVTHESSGTGAPLLGLNLIRHYSEKHNVINIILKNSNIHNDFIQNACLTYSGLGDNSYISAKYILKELLAQMKIEFVIANSIESSPVISAAYEAGIPNLCLIHEFSEYTRPVGKITTAVLESDMVVVPAKIVYDSVIKEFNSSTHLNLKPNNININKQGKLKYFPSNNLKKQKLNSAPFLIKNDYDTTKFYVITGAGWVQQRKGVDLFIQLAASIKSKTNLNIKFIWVGGGYDPINDVSYSIYLEKLINEFELQKHLIMLEHQDDLQGIWDITDIFVLSSRFDPFPNVAVDAMDNNIPVACFKNGSGTYEFLMENNGDAIFAKYLDVEEMAEGIVNRINIGLNKSSVNRNLVEAKLNFERYAEDILLCVERVIEKRCLNNQMIDELIKFASINSKEVLSTNDRFEIKKYVDLGMKGLHFKNPIPGFSDIKWIYDTGTTMASVPFYEAINTNQKSTHAILDINNINFKSEETFPKYAIHIHIHYENTLEYFYPYIESLPPPYDIYITTTLPNIDNEANIIRKISRGQFLRVIKTKNIGRDIGPFIFDLNDAVDLNKYDVVGHFHGKKSVHMGIDESFKWMKYLLDNLIGKLEQVKKILHLFSNNDIGLIFVDEQYAIDIGKNKCYISDLCDMLKIKTITETPIFPVGNMFWVRPAAIKQLLLLNRDLVLEEEPLPNDGTFLHAIERITPHLIDSNGYNSIVLKAQTLRTNYSVCNL